MTNTTRKISMKKNKSKCKKYNYVRITKTINGKKKEFSGKTKAEVQKKIKEYEQTHMSSNLEFFEMKFQDLFELWFYGIKRHDSIKPSTYMRYDTVYRNHIKDSSISNIAICKMKSLDLQRFVNELIKKGNSPDSIKNTFKVIKMFFKYLVIEDAMVKDITLPVKLPKSMKVQKKIRTFTNDERSLITEHLDQFRFPFLIQLGFASGMRLGEMLALSYEDFRDGGVYVEKTLSCSEVIISEENRERKKMILPPKSKTSVRFIPLPDVIFAYLEQHRLRQKELLLSNGARMSEYCFTQLNGELLDTPTIGTNIQKFFKKCGVLNHSAHDMRHTYITNLIESGAPLSVVKELAGHSDIKMTMRYTHISLDSKVKAVDMAFERLVL